MRNLHITVDLESVSSSSSDTLVQLLVDVANGVNEGYLSGELGSNNESLLVYEIDQDED